MLLESINNIIGTFSEKLSYSIKFLLLFIELLWLKFYQNNRVYHFKKIT